MRVLASALFLAYKASACKWSSSEGATYDLSSLVHSQTHNISAYEVDDTDPNVMYYYRFNVCGNVGSKDPSQDVPGCAGKGNSPAYQLDHNNPNFCERLGGDFTASGEANFHWSLHDEADPAGGVVLHYTNGDTSFGECAHENGRELDVHFVCRERQVGNIPDVTEEFIEEPEKCEYSVMVYTADGCPQECDRVEGVVCGNKGSCGYDAGQEAVRCFCDQGFSGSDCQEKSGSGGGGGGGVSGNHAALIIVCLLLVGVVGLLIYMWNKLRRLQLDPDAYAQLGNRFNELGQVSA